MSTVHEVTFSEGGVTVECAGDQERGYRLTCIGSPPTDVVLNARPLAWRFRAKSG